MNKIRFRHHFRAVPFLLGITFLSVVFAGMTGFDPFAVKVFSVFMFVMVVPCIFIHIEYLRANAGFEFEINNTGIQVTRGGKVVRVVDTGDIKNIAIYKSPNLRYRFVHLASEYYYYARITMHDSSADIIITSLVTNEDFDELSPLWQVKTETKKTLFPSIRFPVVLPALN